MTNKENGYNIYKVSSQTKEVLKRGEKDMLNDRKKRILQAIIEEYISTAEPVSSAAILQNYGLSCSSATIRNDMSELEHIGYLDKPHTSAGRVPSPKGYRFYVDELLKDDNISLEEMSYIKAKLETKVNEIEELTKIATTTLSEITHYTTVAIGPSASMHHIVDIKFVLLGSRVLMAVILTDAGAIKETIIKFDEDITERQVESMNILFNQRLRGISLGNITEPFEQYIMHEMANEVKVIRPVIEQIEKAMSQDADIYMEGASKVFDFPEFKKIELARNFLNVLDTKELVMDILNSGFAKDINVYIGDENEYNELKDLSVITFKHTSGGKDLGTIGIIGPTRMDYSKVISVMKYVSKKLNEQLGNDIHSIQ